MYKSKAWTDLESVYKLPAVIDPIDYLQRKDPARLYTLPGRFLRLRRLFSWHCGKPMSIYTAWTYQESPLGRVKSEVSGNAVVCIDCGVVFYN